MSSPHVPADPKSVSSLSNQDLESTLRENRVFPPPEEFSKQAHIKSLEEYEAMYRESVEDPEEFWAGIANELHWFKKWDKVLEWNLPWAKWFVGGKINLSYNCLDRHVADLRARTRPPSSGKSEPGEVRTLTYSATASRSAEVRQRPEVAGRQERRPRRDLHGHDARAADRHAGLRPHRRRHIRGLRRILRQCPGRSHQRLAGASPSSRRTRLPPRHRSQAYCRAVEEALQVLPHGEARRRLQAHRLADQHAVRPRPLVARR